MGSQSRSGWPLPERAFDHLVLDTRRATLVYWAGVAFVVAGLFVPRLLPCVDYPQHLALSDVARRLGDPAAPENSEYQLNYFTYNALFHVLVALLSRVVAVELAGRVVLALSLAGMAGAVVALVRVLRRPPVYAALFTPVLFSFSVGWGFVNYVLATAIAAWTLVLVARAAVRPTARLAAGVAALGLACAFAHVLATIILCVVAAALACELAWRSASRGKAPGRPGPARVACRAAVATSPLLLGCIYCVLVYRKQYAWAPWLYHDPVLEGTAPPLWRKVVFFGRHALGLFRDGSDQVFLWTAVVVIAAAAWLAWRRRREDDATNGDLQPIVAPFVALTLAYLATPTVIIGTHLVFQRLGQWVVLGALLAAPGFPASVASRVHRGILALAVLAGVNVTIHCTLYARETDDASRVIDDLPAGRAATAVIWEPGTRAFRSATLTHLAAYYAARKHGEWAFAFARYLSVPVRFRSGSQPAWPARGWEFKGPAYDPRCKYARAFPLVIVEAPGGVPEDASGEAALRKLVFKQDGDAVKLLSHHGRYWAFDTTGLPDDGTS